MEPIEIVAQVISIIAMFFNIISYQQKSHARIMACQMVGCLLFGTSYFMLGATIGGILNAVGIMRSVVFIFREKFHADKPVWLAVFIGLYITSYVLVFTVFGKEFGIFNAISELLPVIAMTALTIAFRLTDARAIRMFGLVASPCWLAYNIISMSIGAIICEALSLVSIIIGMIRLDKVEKSDTEKS